MLTTNIHRAGAAVTFPHGYTVMLIVSVVVTAAACAVGATIAGRAGLVAIPLGLGLSAITGFALILAGASLGHHARLIDWGVTLLAAALAGAAPDSRSPHGDDRRSQNPPQPAREFLEPGKPGLVPGVRVGSRRVPASAGDLPAAPWATAQITRICTVFESLELGQASAGAIVVHYDVDAVDSADLPLANYPHHGKGLTFDAAITVLRELCASPAFAGLVLTEVNPTHDPGGDLLGRYVDGVTAALAGAARDR